MITFQDLIQKLVNYWASKGCIVHQGHDLEMGAGTFNPATFLRCLGPEPYNTVYVEPSRRPQDGRYGDNPNRLQLFHQLQVIMKPSPSNIQDLYLESLRVVGFDLTKHDVRFVHDDWESPTLGAWGLGWEVWIDGMEVTQFTYFQSIAGIDLSPISVELTYGLERLCMFAQGVNSFYDMKYNENLSYKDVFHRNEVEWSTYNFNESSSDMWFRHFEDFEKEAKNLINLNLPIPAYDFVMKASHAFNMLEARGVISVTERTNYIHRIRELARLSAIEYLATRERLDYPLLKKKHQEPQDSHIKIIEKLFDPKDKKDFLLEIGVEQLPATFVPIGVEQLKSAIQSFCSENNLSFSAIESFGTPQRISVIVKDLAAGTKDETIQRRGPQLSVVFDEEGKLTKQGSGFFQSIGIDAITNKELTDHPQIQTTVIKDKEYLIANLEKKGESTYALLQKALPGIVSNINFPKSMRWGNYNFFFARPIKWLLALLEKDVVPFSLVDIQSSNYTYGHAQLAPNKITIENPLEYEEKLQSSFVLASIEKRKNNIESQLDELLSKKNFEAVKRDEVLKEVLFLTEWPSLCLHTFNEDFLKIPDEVLISEMVSHQKYFPVADSKTKKLTPNFVITADNTPNPQIEANNETVLSARLSDGVFLYNQDLKVTMEEFNEKLRTITFHKKLGSVFDKVKRIKSVASSINHILKVCDEQALERAAELCKSDLASDMVGEFPELQGVIGMYYARHQGEKESVALAIKEHWMPIFEKGELPSSSIGKVLSIADKIDNISSYFSVGIKPTSSKDPYALRRQTLGILKILIESSWSFSLKEFLLDLTEKKHLVEEICEFIKGRMRSIFEDMGFLKDEIEASLAYSNCNPFEEYEKLRALSEFRKTSGEFSGLIEVYKRAKGQIGSETKKDLLESLLQEQAEKQLFITLQDINKPFIESLSNRHYQQSFELLTKLQKPLAQLFDEVKILHEDESIKNNRIALLQHVFEPFKKLIDLGKLQIS